MTVDKISIFKNGQKIHESVAPDQKVEETLWGFVFMWFVLFIFKNN